MWFRNKEYNIDGLEMHNPVNLEECFAVLSKYYTKEVIKEFKNIEEDIVIPRCHFGIGVYIRNSWKLWDKKSVLHKFFFVNYGIFHADDMSGIILISFHRYLNNKPLEIESQLKLYKDYWNRKENQSAYFYYLNS